MPLSGREFRALDERMREAGVPADGDRELTFDDLTELGCSRELAARILRLLGREELLWQQVWKWRRAGVDTVTWRSGDYPVRLRQRLGSDAPPVLFLRGDRRLLTGRAVGLAGSRDLTDLGTRYAAAIGRMAAAKGYVLASGNARGADQTGQEACLAAGGSVVAFVPGRLTALPPRPGVLYVSEGGPNLGFTAERALRRNRLIHCLGPWTFLAQVRHGRGGTWNGACHNLEHHLSHLYVPEDGSPGAAALAAMGAKSISLRRLQEAAEHP